MSQNNSDDLKPMSDGDKTMGIDSSAQSNLQSVQENSASECEDVVEKFTDLTIPPTKTSGTGKLISAKNDSSGFTTPSNSDVINTSKTSQNHSSGKSDNLETVSQNIKQENIPTTSSNLGEIKPPPETVRNAMAWDAYTPDKQRRLRKLQDVRNKHVSKLPGIKEAYSKILEKNKYEKIGSVLDKLLELEMDAEKFNRWMKSIGIKHNLWINECYKSLLEWGTKENELKKEK